MRILLAALNAKYIHSCLALYYLKESLAQSGLEAEIREFTINIRIAEIARDIFRCQPDLVAFSCYIWNREETLRVCAILKKVLPQVTIVLGGPEVSFSGRELLLDHPAVDYVVVGEGERTFPELIKRLTSGEGVAEIPGVVWRGSEEPRQNQERPTIDDLDQIPFPYADHTLANLQNRIIYYEASRGCPFQCLYCLSSRLQGMRYFSLHRVRRDLRRLIAAGVKQVKFVDRTFNCHPERTREIISFLIDLHPAEINFHLEIAADLLDQQTIALLQRAPAGLFQLEIGVQSTNPQVLTLIRRRMDFSRVRQAVLQLQQAQNVHLHLDLIAGLPEEDLSSFENSFNQVFALHPHQLQLGFLKLLPGTELMKRAGEWSLVFQDNPPREILQTRVLDYAQLLELKEVEAVLERYYNSGRFRQTICLASSRYPQGAYQFFLALSRCFDQEQEVGEDEAARILWTFLSNGQGDAVLWEDLMKMDLLLSGRGNKFLRWLKENRGEGPEHLPADLPRPRGMTVGQMGKTIFREQFHHTFIFAAGVVVAVEDKPSTLLFDCRSHHPVSGYPVVAAIF